FPVAMSEGVLVSLGTDWTPSGSKNLLGELKIADKVNKVLFNKYITDYQFVQMVTSNPAKTLGWEGFTGTLKKGLYADIVVVKDSTKIDPFPSVYRALINSTEKDVVLVLIEGEPLYGEVEKMNVLKPGDYDIVCGQSGFVKAVDVTKPSAKKGSQTFWTIKEILAKAMQFLPVDMMKVFDDAVNNNMTLDEFKTYLAAKFPNGIVPIPLDPLFVTDDALFFQRLTASSNMKKAVDMSDFQKTYYPYMGQGSSDVVIGSVDAGKILDFVNAAKLETLIDEVGLDIVTASAIIGHIQSDGPFTTIDELQTVAGICAVILINSYVNSSGDPEPPPPPPDETPEQKALKFLNHQSTTLKILDDTVGLTSTAANNIIVHRNGPDGKYPSTDDNPFDSIAELDSVPYVGDSVIQKIISYASTWKPPDEEQPSAGKTLEFLNHPSTTVEILDVNVGLTATAATNIIAYRNGADKAYGTSDDNPFDSIAELDSVPYVGASAIASIEAYAAKWSPPAPANPDQKLLDFVNHKTTTKDVLTKAGLTSTAASYVIKHRDGADGVYGTSDDNPFDSKDELDSVPYIGPSSLAALEQYAATWSPTVEIPKVLVFLNHEATTFDVLNKSVGLASNVATNIIAHRNGADKAYGTEDDNPFDSIEELDSVPYVGSTIK
ncbi:MAG: amidohydrolase family protein, partial [Deltaproteobacteria bacterium]|nr:amidohydrolase family protein [Deltaproteobacteria bacterium]